MLRWSQTWKRMQILVIQARPDLWAQQVESGSQTCKPNQTKKVDFIEFSDHNSNQF